jgi:hypothetical protein
LCVLAARDPRGPLPLLPLVMRRLGLGLGGGGGGSGGTGGGDGTSGGTGGGGGGASASCADAGQAPAAAAAAAAVAVTVERASGRRDVRRSDMPAAGGAGANGAAAPHADTPAAWEEEVRRRRQHGECVSSFLFTLLSFLSFSLYLPFCLIPSDPDSWHPCRRDGRAAPHWPTRVV